LTRVESRLDRQLSLRRIRGAANRQARRVRAAALVSTVSQEQRFAAQQISIILSVFASSLISQARVNGVTGTAGGLAVQIESIWDATRVS
jgi:hypothetical protein